MSKTTAPVSLSIMDKEYKIACAEDEQETLISTAKELDRQMRAIKDSGRVNNAERIAVIAALNMANELLVSQNHNPTSFLISEQLNKLRIKIENILEN